MVTISLSYIMRVCCDSTWELSNNPFPQRRDRWETIKFDPSLNGLSVSTQWSPRSSMILHWSLSELYGPHQGSSHGGRRRAVPPGTANFRPALGFKLDAPPGTNRTKICWICTNSIVFQASKVIVFAQCKFCMHYFAKDTHHTAREQNYFLEKCSEPVLCDPFGRTAIRAPISELTPAQTLLGCARH